MSSLPDVKNQTLVSIIIPCRNAAPWLRQTLDSALAQTWPKTEIIAVDDGSTDESLNILKSYQDRGIKVFHGPQRNASAARNEGLLQAQGEWIQFLDADDLLDPKKIEAQMICTEKREPHFLFSGAWDRFYQDPSEAQFHPHPNWKNIDPVEFLQLHWEQCLMMHPAAWLTSRALIDKAGVWNENITLNDDGEFFARIMLASNGILFCPEAKSYYRSGLPKSLSGQKNPAALASLYLSTDLMTKAVLEKEKSPRTQACCAYAWKWTAFELYPGHPELSLAAEAHSQHLGGSSRPFHAGGKFQLASKLLSWRLAKHLFCS
jgi:glycosyltransferase involved in cell wall biosynthesis